MKIVLKNGKISLQSFGLLSFTIIFYGRNRLLHLAKIQDQDIFLLCEEFYPRSAVLHLVKDTIDHTPGRYT